MLIRLRYWTALLVVGGIAFGVWAHLHKDSEPGSSAVTDRQRDNGHGKVDVEDALEAPQTAGNAPLNKPENSVTWSRVVGAGDSMSLLLAKAGLDTDAITEVSRAIASEFDLRHLKPGYSLTLTMSEQGAPKAAMLEIDNGFRILATFGAAPHVERLAPDLDSIRRAGEATVKSSIFAALDDAGIPTRFATDLELILAETFDLRSALAGGERIRLMWREHRSGDRVVGEPTIDFAQFDLADRRYEILWPDDKSRRTRIFQDGELVKTFDQPIRGARLSSSFGLRKHPIHGYVRMHSGVDFAADHGAVVVATQVGTIKFMGKRSGYGHVVELDHGNNIQTLYAHLSAVNEALQVGQRVAAGSEIGRAGSTGTSTAPHLHYEIHVDGKPVSPLADTRLRGPGNGAPRRADGLVSVDIMQSELDRLLESSG